MIVRLAPIKRKASEIGKQRVSPAFGACTYGTILIVLNAASIGENVWNVKNLGVMATGDVLSGALPLNESPLSYVKISIYIAITYVN